MTPRPDIDQAVQTDYAQAMSKGLKHRFVGHLRLRNSKLLSYSDLLEHYRVRGQHDLGPQIVPIDQIRGSVGRSSDFDRDFFPCQFFTCARWMRIARAFYENVALPLVELYKVDDTYYVKDGHHRISVARSRGQVYIDAQVVEVELQNRPGDGFSALKTRHDNRRIAAIGSIFSS